MADKKKKIPVKVKIVSVKKKKSVSVKEELAPAGKKTPVKKAEKIPRFKKILGDEFLAISAIILFGSFLKLGWGFYSIAVTLFIIAAFSFIAGIAVKGYIKGKC